LTLDSESNKKENPNIHFINHDHFTLICERAEILIMRKSRRKLIMRKKYKNIK